jgi:phosphopantetheinyl transferase (holo-ACP synthase)
MIGNDVIDLALACKESNWRRTGFLEKIFTDKEQLLIKNSTNPELLIWNLWSRKESAYKIFNRETGIRAYIPKQLECFYTNDSLGFVLCNGNCYYTLTTIENDFLHTIAASELSYLDQIISIDTKTAIIKKEGVPFLHSNDEIALQPLSISHHGRYNQTIALKFKSILLKT